MERLAVDGATERFVDQTYRHAKALGVLGEAAVFLTPKSPPS